MNMNGKEEYNFLTQTISSRLNKYKYSVEKYVYDEKEFGNYEAIFVIDNIKIKVTRDKEQIFFEIGSLAEFDEWFDLELVIESQGGKITIHKKQNTEKQISEYIKILDQNFSKIRALFSNKNYFQTKSNLKKMEKARVKSIFGLDV